MFVYFLAIGYRFFIKPELSWVEFTDDNHADSLTVT